VVVLAGHKATALSAQVGALAAALAGVKGELAAMRAAAAADAAARLAGGGGGGGGGGEAGASDSGGELDGSASSGGSAGEGGGGLRAGGAGFSRVGTGVLRPGAAARAEPVALGELSVGEVVLLDGGGALAEGDVARVVPLGARAGSA
jgi:hypothetical protein